MSFGSNGLQANAKNGSVEFTGGEIIIWRGKVEIHPVMINLHEILALDHVPPSDDARGRLVLITAERTLDLDYLAMERGNFSLLVDMVRARRPDLALKRRRGFWERLMERLALST